MGFSKKYTFLFLLIVVSLFLINSVFRKKINFFYIQKLYRQQNYKKLLKKIDDNYYLKGKICLDLKKYSSAVTNFQKSTNIPNLYFYSFYNIGISYKNLGSTNCIYFFNKVFDSKNDFLKYKAFVSLGDYYFDNLEFNKALENYKSAQNIDLKLNKKYNSLYKILNRYYRTKNTYKIGLCYFRLNNSKYKKYFFKILNNNNSRRNIYAKKIISILTNYSFSDYKENYIMAKQISIFNRKSKKIIYYVNFAIEKSKSKKDLYDSLNLLFRYYFNINKEKVLEYIKKYKYSFLYSTYYDNLLYNESLYYYYKNEFSYSTNLLNTILNNNIKNKEVENKAISLFFNIYKKSNFTNEIKFLFSENLKKIKKNRNLSKKFFLFAIENYYSNNINLIYYLTNLPEKPEILYIVGNYYLNNGNYKKAYNIFKKIVEDNNSYFYTIYALNAIKSIYRKDKKIKRCNLQISKKIKKKIKGSKNYNIKNLNNRYLKILALNPYFFISRKDIKKIIAKSPILRKDRFNTKNEKAFDKIKFYFDNLLIPEGEIELLLNDRNNIAFYIKLVEYFSDKNYPYYSVKYAERIKRILKINFPEYRIKDNIIKYLYPVAYKDEVKKYSSKYKIDKNLIFAVIREESRFKYNAVSVAGATGLMQLMPSTFKYISEKIKLKKKNIVDPDVNIESGTKLLKDLLKNFDNEFYALSAYNAGGGNLKRWIKNRKIYDNIYFLELIPFIETEYYIKKIYYSKLCYKFLKNIKN